MGKLDYEQIMTIQENATRKLLNYIDDFFQKEKTIDSIEFYYPDFDERRTRMAFNVWISLDYRTKYGKNFIEHFLEEESHKLDDLEKEVLIERNKSHISLFEIKNINGDLMYVEDIFSHTHHIVWEPELSQIVEKSELIFGRVAKVIVYEKFVGDISFLPLIGKEPFARAIYYDYNLIRRKEPNISMEEYLRKYSLNIYKAYTDCIYEILDFDDDESLKLSKELGEFEDYLEENLSENTVKKHIKNLIDLYDYYLYDNELTLYDIDKINFDSLFKEGVNSGLIRSQAQLNSYIATIKKYIKFLIDNEVEGDYEKSYNDIIDISKNRESYFTPKAPIAIPFKWDKDLDMSIKDNLNSKTISFLKNYEKYLFSIENDEENIDYKSPLLNLFYKFSLCYNILSVSRKKLVYSSKKEEYLKLSDWEKAALFIDYIWNILKWDELTHSTQNTLEQDNRFEIADNLSNLTTNTIYNYEKIKYKSIETPIFDKYIIKFFDLMGLLNYDENSIFENNSAPSISITPLGKKVFDVLKEDKNKNIENMGKIIHLNQWKKDR